ncbi:Metallo-dependent hydrolase [Roridomyces roridus]|uniref:Metallo-dependent hydrolase n=1 Tax=Roridomyces roridus TaxID=1738132 RepID=A0AAD7BAS6_9AGAR|nr:Metallo-dependent hydrolase [Roridomyces roridus]
MAMSDVCIELLEEWVFCRWCPASDALASLTQAQISFIQSLPKAELHAHLNGCIPISELQKMAREYSESGSSSLSSASVLEGIEKLQSGIVLDQISDFFGLFSAIYALTSNPESLRRATRALRSTPRETSEMSRMDYVRAVLEEVERYPKSRAALIVSLDRRMADEVVSECVQVAVRLKEEGRRVVGVDLCGDPQAGDMDTLAEHFATAKRGGLTVENSVKETLKLLSYAPDRLGHATFLDEAAKSLVREAKMPIEMCLSSNLLCKTVSSLAEHHIRYYLRHDHPIAICTDDTLPFRTSLLGEYALLLAAPPLGLGLSENEVRRIAAMGMNARFGKQSSSP